MKLTKFLLTLFAFTLVNVSAATLSWNRNPEPGVAYRVYSNWGQTNATVVDVGLNITYVIPASPDSTRVFQVSAYYTNTLVESDLSASVTYTDYPALPAIAAIGYTLGDFRAGQWQNVNVRWNSIDKVRYGVGDYTLIAASSLGTNTYTTASTNYTIATLPRATWSFYVTVSNLEGTSPLGTALVLNGTKPNTPVSVTVSQ